MHPSIYPSSVSDAYSIRIMVGFVLSLSLVVVVLNTRFGAHPGRVGWTAAAADRPSHRIAVSEIETESPDEDVPRSVNDAPPPTDVESSNREQRPKKLRKRFEADDTHKGQDDPTQAQDANDRTVRRMATLDAEADQPGIEGGMGRLYVEIEYPEKARRQGIQGELMLEFTVEPDGSVNRIEVVEPLHPLCDSAAVEGVRSVKFVPAKHNGRAIPVRMTLPVQFRLISFPSLPSTAGHSS